MNVSDLANGVRKLQSLSKQLSDIEFQEKIIELRTLLNEAQEEILQREQEKRDLRQTIEELKTALSFSEDLVDIKGWKYRTDENGNPTGYPFCPRCEVDDGKYFQLVNPKGQRTQTLCPNCKVVFGFSAKRMVSTKKRPSSGM